jgi:hypothetical protein
MKFGPSAVEIISLNQLESTRALKSEGGIAAFGSGVNIVGYGLSIPANRSWTYVFKYTGSSPSLIGQNGSVAVTYQ